MKKLLVGKEKEHYKIGKTYIFKGVFYRLLKTSKCRWVGSCFLHLKEIK